MRLIRHQHWGTTACRTPGLNEYNSWDIGTLFLFVRCTVILQCDVHHWCNPTLGDFTYNCGVHHWCNPTLCCTLRFKRRQQAVFLCLGFVSLSRWEDTWTRGLYHGFTIQHQRDPKTHGQKPGAWTRCLAMHIEFMCLVIFFIGVYLE